LHKKLIFLNLFFDIKVPPPRPVPEVAEVAAAVKNGDGKRRERVFGLLVRFLYARGLLL
jgi:hypothetical protein